MSDSRAIPNDGSRGRLNSSGTSPAVATVIFLAVVGSVATSSPDTAPPHQRDFEAEALVHTLLPREVSTHSIEIIVDEPEHVYASSLRLSIHGMAEVHDGANVPNVTGWLDDGREERFVRFEGDADMQPILSSHPVRIPDCIRADEWSRVDVAGPCSLDLIFEVSNWSEYPVALTWKAVLVARWRTEESLGAKKQDPFRIAIELEDTGPIPGSG